MTWQIAQVTARHVALAYLEGFACLGSACEDSCCGGWIVELDEAHHDRLRAQMAKDGELATFKARIKRSPAARASHRFAVINQHAGRCTFLEADRRCEIHRRHGEDLLPDGCAMYPRQVGRIGARIEVSASVSCPEIARRALLVDGATDLVPCDPAVAGRGVVAQEVAPDDPRPYVAAIDRVRATMFALFARRDHAMAARLFFVAHLADRIGDFLVDETDAIAPGRLDGVLAAYEDDATLAALARQLDTAQVPAELGPATVLQLVSERLRGPVPAVFRRLFTEVLRRLARDGGGVALAGDRIESASISPPALAAYLAGHRAARAARLGDRLELALENYARNWVMREWYVSAPDLATHVQRLLVRVAIARFLLLQDPRLDDAPELDALLVEVVYATARTFDHAPGPVHEATVRQLGEIPSVVAAVALLRV